jgi:hypothetical protein
MPAWRADPPSALVRRVWASLPASVLEHQGWVSLLVSVRPVLAWALRVSASLLESASVRPEWVLRPRMQVARSIELGCVEREAPNVRRSWMRSVWL